MPPKEHRTNVGVSDSPVGYDQKLIAKAPEITKADRQVRCADQVEVASSSQVSSARTWLHFLLQSLTYRFGLASV
jgi:hypothetical protein